MPAIKGVPATEWGGGLEGGGREVVQMIPLVRVERAQRQRERPYRCADAHARDPVPRERARARVWLRQGPDQLVQSQARGLLAQTLGVVRRGRWAGGARPSRPRVALRPAFPGAAGAAFTASL